MGSPLIYYNRRNSLDPRRVTFKDPPPASDPLTKTSTTAFSRRFSETPLGTLGSPRINSKALQSKMDEGERTQKDDTSKGRRMSLDFLSPKSIMKLKDPSGQKGEYGQLERPQRVVQCARNQEEDQGTTTSTQTFKSYPKQERRMSVKDLF